MLCRPPPPEDHRRDLIAAWRRPDLDVSAGDLFVSDPNEGTVGMIVIGADTHMHSHTVAAVDAATGRACGDRTARAKRRSFDDLLRWARGVGAERVWAIEDRRHVSGALERFLLKRGEPGVRVAPKLMAAARRSARERGKSDVIDAVAIARAGDPRGPRHPSGRAA